MIKLLLLPRWPSAPSADAKRLIIIRHAEGWHNKDYLEKPNYMADALGETEEYWDARLTPTGVEQATKLAQKLQELDADVELVTTSPLSRAVQTASIAFPAESGGWPMMRPPFVASSLARERVWTHQCDRRRSRDAIEREFPHVDFSEVAAGEDEMWATKETVPSQLDSDAVRARARRFLQWLWARPETVIAVCSHFVFLSHLFELYPDVSRAAGSNLGNADFRLVTLVRAADAKQKPPDGTRKADIGPTGLGTDAYMV